MSKLTSALLALTIILTTAATGLAQGFSVGGRLGVGISDLDVEGGDLDTRTGIVVGGFVGIDLGPLFNLRPEVQYAQKGAEISEDGFTTKIKLVYVEVALPATITIPVPNAPIEPRLYAGPNVGLEISCDIEGEVDGFSGEASCEDAGLETKSVDFGVLIGAGVDIPAGPGAVTLDGRYILGVTNINDSADPDLSGDVKNRSWQFLAGYAIRVGV